MKMVNTHHRQELIEAKAQSSRRLQGCTALASSLLCDLRSVLRGYVGRRVLARKPPGVVSGNSRQAVSGTVVNSFIEKEHAYVVVEWHTSANKTIISLRQLVESGDFTVEEAGQRNVLRSRGRPVRCSKGDGAMKYP